MHLNPATGAFDADPIERIPFLYTTFTATQFGGIAVATNATPNASGQPLYVAKGGEVLRNLSVKTSAAVSAGGLVVEVQKSTDGGGTCAALATPLSVTLAAGATNNVAAGPSSALAQYDALFLKAVTVNLAGGTVVWGYFEVAPN